MAPVLVDQRMANWAAGVSGPRGGPGGVDVAVWCLRMTLCPVSRYH